MALQALLLTEDPEMYGVLSPVLQDMGITFRTAENPSQADFFLRSAIFDAVFVDCDGLPGAIKFFTDVRLSSSKNCTAFAVVHGKTSTKEAFLLGANYVVEKPLTGERVRESLRSAMNMMLRERRRYARHTLNGSAVVWYGGDKKVVGRTVNLSEGGVAIELPENVDLGLPVRIQFDLPGGRHIDAKGVVAWEADTHIGIKLLFMAANVRHDLDNWIVDRLIDAERKQPHWAAMPAKSEASPKRPST